MPKAKKNFMMQTILLTFYIGIKVYLFLIVLGGVTLYFVSPQFRAFVVLSSSYKDICIFVNQVKVINLNVPLSNRERAMSYLGFILIGSWFLNEIMIIYNNDSLLWMSEFSNILRHRGFCLTGLTLTQLSRHSHLRRKISFGNSQVKGFMGKQEFFRMGKIFFTYNDAGLAFYGFATGLALATGVNGISDTRIARPFIQVGRVMVLDISGTEFINSILNNAKYNEEFNRLLEEKNEVHMKLLRENPTKYYENFDSIPEIDELEAAYKKRWETMLFGKKPTFK